MGFAINFDFTVQAKVNDIIETLGFEHIDASKVIVMRSKGSKASAYARIWALDKAWQLALNVEPHYIIEVLSEKYEKLSDEDKEKTLIHELLHIAHTFNGNLVPHNCFGKKMMSNKKVTELHTAYKNKKKIDNSPQQLKLGIEY